MINSVGFQKPTLTVLYSVPQNRTQKYIFRNKSAGAIKIKKGYSVDMRVALNEINNGLSWFKPNKSLTSINGQMKDKSRNTNNYGTNASSIISSLSTKRAFGRTVSRTESNRLKTITIKSKMKNKNNMIKPRLNQSKGITEKTINIFRNKPISQLTKYLNLNRKPYPILASKKKIPYILPKNSNLDYKLTADSFLYYAYFPIERNRTKEIHKHINSLHREIMLEYAEDFRIIHSDVFNDYKHINANQKARAKEASPLLPVKINKKRRILEDVIQLQINKQQNDEINNKKKKLYETFKTTMLKAAMHFVKCRISISDYYNYKYDKIPEYQSNELYYLIQAIKQNNFNTVSSTVYKNKYILFDADHVSIISDLILVWPNSFALGL